MEKEEFEIMYHIEQSHWWFRGKQFLLRQALSGLDNKALEKGRILDIGAGTGIILKILQNFGETYGIELSLQAIKYLRKRELKRIICADADHCLPFKDDTFTIITCLDVLEHLEQDVRLLKEMIRVSKPGGHILVAVPAFDIFWSAHDVALHHKRRYTRKKILRIIHEMNCKIVKSSYYNFTLSMPILAVRTFKSIFSHSQQAQSDFFLSLPNIMNLLLGFLYKAELRCLKLINFPFGVSILLILRKSDGDKPGIEIR
jgi:ubiquinone/menaquinone biosynthesis C-methylase UbiE